ncbi:hypothetical protein NBRC116494_17380 [Aurantivibrio plasticivorans]
MAEERRSFFRVNKEVLLDYKPVESFSAQRDSAESQFENTLPLALIAEFNGLDQQLAKQSQHLAKMNEEVASYLKILNRKIDLLGRHFIAQSTPKQEIASRINISEAGIAFLSKTPLYKDSFIAMRLVFLPNYAGVVTFAQVARCAQEKSDQYHIAAKFHRLGSSQQAILAKQIMESQRKAKQEKSA